MIAFIKGTVESCGSDWIIVDHDGMGWQMAYPHPEQVHIGQEIKVYTYLHISEQDVSMFGFESRNEKDLFLRLISVKGLGPKTAMNMLSRSSADAIIQAIETGNAQVLKKMPGIGGKTASQIILDLKGKLVAVETQNPKNKTSYSAEIQDACEGLKNLGCRQSEVDTAAAYMNKSPGLTTEQYLKLGLQYLMKARGGF